MENKLKRKKRKKFQLKYKNCLCHTHPQNSVCIFYNDTHSLKWPKISYIMFKNVILSKKKNHKNIVRCKKSIIYNKCVVCGPQKFILPPAKNMPLYKCLQKYCIKKSLL